MRQYRGGFGHNPSGKLYTYLGPDGIRIGQHVVAPVEKGGKNYNTMFTILKTNADDNPYAEMEEQMLENLGINLKIIPGTDVINMLPGGLRYREDPRYNTLQSMKAAWTKDSNRRRDKEIAERLGRAYPTRDSGKAILRLLEGRA